MSKRRITAAMELLLRVSLCLLTFIGKTFGDEIGTKKISWKEDKDVILHCSFNESLTTKRFDWKKDGKDVFLYDNGKVQYFGELNHRVSHFSNQLNSGNASIRITKAQISDTGNYTCLYIDSSKSYTIELTVVLILKDRTGETRNGSFGKPSVQRLNGNEDGALLRCEVLGAYPKPTLAWYDSAGNKIDDKKPNWTEKENHYDIFLETKVVKSGNYTCVATQEEIYHQSNKTTFANITDNNTLYIGIGIGVLIGAAAAVAVAVAVAVLCWKRKRQVRLKGDISLQDCLASEQKRQGQ